VATIKGTDLGVMTRAALEVFGGAKSFVNPGDSVFIKMNLCTAGFTDEIVTLNGDSSKPDIAIALAEECLLAGARQVLIGDAAQVKEFDYGRLPTIDNRSTFEAEAMHLNHRCGPRVKLVCLHRDTPEWRILPALYSGLGTVSVSSLVADSDKIISVGVLKTHRWAKITGALKNFVGVTPTSVYGLGFPWRFKLHEAPAGIEQAFLDINHALKPHFAIMDCSIGCEGNGPHVMPGYWGTTVDLRDRLGAWVLLAGPDFVAVDSTAARMIGLEPDQVPTLSKGYQQGLGQMLADKIDLDGALLEDIRVEWKQAEPLDGPFDLLLPGLAMIGAAMRA
jgi:uncharacterized protein (DUF362 family)